MNYCVRSVLGAGSFLTLGWGLHVDRMQISGNYVSKNSLCGPTSAWWRARAEPEQLPYLRSEVARGRKSCAQLCLWLLVLWAALGPATRLAPARFSSPSLGPGPGRRAASRCRGPASLAGYPLSESYLLASLNPGPGAWSTTKFKRDKSTVIWEVLAYFS